MNSQNNWLTFWKTKTSVSIWRIVKDVLILFKHVSPKLYYVGHKDYIAFNTPPINNTQKLMIFSILQPRKDNLILRFRLDEHVNYWIDIFAKKGIYCTKYEKIKINIRLKNNDIERCKKGLLEVISISYNKHILQKIK